MSRKALEDTKHELIKAHVLDPDSSPLPAEQQELLDRVVSASKILDKNPIQKQAVAIHQQKYPTISRSQAYEDLRLATRLFNTLHTFDWDLWRTWLLNDVVKNIEKCRNSGTPADRRVIAMEHANLMKAIGEKPEMLPDPKRMEKNAFYIVIQNNNNQQIKVDLNDLDKLPETALREVMKAIYGGGEITESDAENLMNT
ncbi:hypothetical protein [Sunxiuqinia sp. sy24]|uniref:hypothetical protein n=1 Tax=Sunxiuqinia sp. sy24 TaxID=3461495 RepID=UPI004046111E